VISRPKGHGLQSTVAIAPIVTCCISGNIAWSRCTSRYEAKIWERLLHPTFEQLVVPLRLLYNLDGMGLGINVNPVQLPLQEVGDFVDATLGNRISSCSMKEKERRQKHEDRVTIRCHDFNVSCCKSLNEKKHKQC